VAAEDVWMRGQFEPGTCPRQQGRDAHLGVLCGALSPEQPPASTHSDPLLSARSTDRLPHRIGSGPERATQLQSRLPAGSGTSGGWGCRSVRRLAVG
jgi:hypothetical protein